MAKNEEGIDKELFLEKFEKLSLKMEQITNEVTQIKHKLDKSNKMSRTFGLKALNSSEPLNFTKDIEGIGSPTKSYVLSLRTVSEEWKGRRNDFLVTIQQQEKENKQPLKALGIRIPISSVKTLRILAREVLSLLYIACELKGIEINEILRDILQDINKSGKDMVKEVRGKMRL